MGHHSHLSAVETTSLSSHDYTEFGVSQRNSHEDLYMGLLKKIWLMLISFYVGQWVKTVVNRPSQLLIRAHITLKRIHLSLDMTKDNNHLDNT